MSWAKCFFLNYKLFSISDPSTHVIKRIVGLEHDTIFNSKHSHKPVKIPRNHCWVEGDNFCESKDSIKYGPINANLIFGKATHLVYPFQHWRSLRPPASEKPIENSCSTSGTYINHEIRSIC